MYDSVEDGCGRMGCSRYNNDTMEGNGRAGDVPKMKEILLK